MSDFTVDDILSGRDSLRTRAHKARTDFLADKRQKRFDDFEALCEEARHWMAAELGCMDQDADEIKFHEHEFNPDTAEARWTFDGIEFRVRYVEETVAQITNNGQTRNIRERVPKFEMMASPHSSAGWKIVKTLSDVGANL